MTKILIAGGTGLIGRQLEKALNKDNYQVVVLSRNPRRANEFLWNINKEYIDEKALKDVDYIINLTGEGIADKKWTKKRKQEILNSRTRSIDLLLKEVKKNDINLKGFISSSAIGYYGAKTSETIFNETSPSGKDFLGNICLQWEKSALQFQKNNFKTTILRTGIVLTKQGGALSKMKTPIIIPLGSGNQYISWIDINDLCQLYIHIIKNNLEGIFNAVSPDYQTNTSFSKVLAKKMKRPFILVGISSLLLKLFLGEMSSLLLEGSRISSKKIQDSGFKFQFPTLEMSLEKLL